MRCSGHGEFHKWIVNRESGRPHMLLLWQARTCCCVIAAMTVLPRQGVVWLGLSHGWGFTTPNDPTHDQLCTAESCKVILFLCAEVSFAMWAVSPTRLCPKLNMEAIKHTTSQTPHRQVDGIAKSWIDSFEAWSRTLCISWQFRLFSTPAARF